MIKTLDRYYTVGLSKKNAGVIERYSSGKSARGTYIFCENIEKAILFRDRDACEQYAIRLRNAKDDGSTQGPFSDSEIDYYIVPVDLCLRSDSDDNVDGMEFITQRDQINTEWVCESGKSETSLRDADIKKLCDVVVQSVREGIANFLKYRFRRKDESNP